MSDFKDSSKMNEADVRETILRPLLERLGYKRGTSCDIITEVSLRYPKQFLGRKKPTKDPLLRGFADYILEIDRRIRWVLEAKPENEEIDIDAIEQAYSYANHSEVRAIYFMVSNGREFKLFLTNNGPHAEPIFSLTEADFEICFQAVVGLIGPDHLRRAFPNFTLDVSPPLGPMLRSFAKVTQGKITYDENTLGHPALDGLNIYITKGSAERTESGIAATIYTEGPNQHVQKFAEGMGADVVDFFSESTKLSINPLEPTKFVGRNDFEVSPNTPIRDFSSGKEVVLAVELKVKVQICLSGYFSGGRFQGGIETTIWMPLILADPFVNKGRFFVDLE